MSFNQRNDRAAGNGEGHYTSSCGPPGPWMRVCEPYLEISGRLVPCVRMRYMGSNPATLTLGVRARKKITKHLLQICEIILVQFRNLLAKNVYLTACKHNPCQETTSPAQVLAASSLHLLKGTAAPVINTVHLCSGM